MKRIMGILLEDLCTFVIISRGFFLGIRNIVEKINPLKPELYPICHLLALAGKGRR